MDPDPTTIPTIGHDERVAAVWARERADLHALAARMLDDRSEADDVLQDALLRLSQVDLDEIHDPRGWLIVVVRRLCLDRIRSARARHESVGGAGLGDEVRPTHAAPSVDPADRVTLDDQVHLALTVVLDRLSPAERTVFLLHDVFAFPFEAIAAIVGRTPAACRQLASRARRSVQPAEGSADARERPREGGDDRPPASVSAVVSAEASDLAEQFIAACAGGDLAVLMALLDPAIDGDATFLGLETVVESEGRPLIAQRLLGLLGPSSGAELVPVVVEGRPGVLAFAHRRVAALIRLDEVDGQIRHIHAFVSPPLPAPRT